MLKTVGASLALPGLPSLLAKSTGGNSAVQATRGAGIGAQRFVAIGNLLGFQQKSIFPETTGKGYEETTLLKPLSENRKNMTLYRGLDHGVKGGHFAVHSFLSGVLHSEAKNRADGNVTIDQFIADEVGVETRFPSLTVGSEGGIHGGCQIAWTRSGIRVPPITGPADLFEKLFVDDSPERKSQRSTENHLQDSILDSVLEDANRLSKHVNREDKEKLDEYFSSIRDVEKRLQARKKWANEPKPKAPFEKPSNSNTVEDLPMLYELISLALQTDSTRIATLEIGGDFEPKDLGIQKGYHSLSHHGKKQENIDQLLVIEEHQLKHFARFLEKLKNTSDGEGSLLDHTSVLFGSGMGNANSHTNHDLPILLAGGGFQHGSFKKLPARGPGKVPLCNLYVSILQQFGMERENFGNSAGSLV